jgi:membrane-bound lytic murein transglycosylase MltF
MEFLHALILTALAILHPHQANPEPPTPKTYAAEQVPPDQWPCLKRLWHRESRWRPHAYNTDSGAYGIAQFLPSTWGSVGAKRTSDWRKQIDAGIVYVEQRYGTACHALDFHTTNGWY